MPFWSSWSIGLFVEGIDTVSRLGQFNANAVSPEHFATFGTRIVRGPRVHRCRRFHRAPGDGRE